MNNSELLDDLFRRRAVRVERGHLFDINTNPKTTGFDFDKIEGMLLGLAVGDSLGVTTEGMLPSERHDAYGVIRDYIPNRYVDKAVGFPSDDTQLSFWTLEQMIEDKNFVPENIARKFSNSGRIFGLGATVREFLRNLKIKNMPWYECGPKSAGNGALMRISPVLIPHLKKGGTDIWVDTVLSAMMTHNDRAAISSCLAFVAMLWELLDMQEAPGSLWWLERYVGLTKDIEGDSHYTPRGGIFNSYNGTLWRFVEEKLAWAFEKDMSVTDACNAWWSGAFLLETVPCVLYILMRHCHDPEESIVQAVNGTKDNDTIASIVGAAVGALHGKNAIPHRWIENLSGRTTDKDDGKVFKLIDEARRVFCDVDQSDNFEKI